MTCTRLFFFAIGVAVMVEACYCGLVAVHTLYTVTYSMGLDLFDNVSRVISVHDEIITVSHQANEFDSFLYNSTFVRQQTGLSHYSPSFLELFHATVML